MAPLELEGETLGKKHEHYNKLVKEASKDYLLQEPSEDDDIRRLLNIDIASKNRNVDYILGILKSEDELYVSKTIKRSTWLITDPQYAHIINPEHLYTEMYSQMTSKSFNKFMLHIRLHLKDEKRVEAFYNYTMEKRNAKSAYKWLQHCSVPFVETEILKYNQEIPDYLVKRLFEKSFTIFEAYHKKYEWMMKESLFLLKKHTVKYLDFIESRKDRFYYDFSAKDTEVLMQTCPQRVIEKLEFYGKYLDIATFAKYLNKTENITEFLIKHSSNEKFKWLYKYDKIQHFIKLIPKEVRFEFVKKVFIDKEVVPSKRENVVGYCASESFMSCDAQCSNISSNTNIYQWYKFAPFESAFTDLKKLIRSESMPDQRTLILQVLLSCAGRNAHHIHTVLQYYCEKHINEPFKFKIKFVNSVISKVDINSLDNQTWAILNKLFHSMEVFVESENNIQSCIQAIIIRNAIRNEPIPDIVEKKFVFNTLKTYGKKMKKKDAKEAIFKYLQDFITRKGNALNLTVESEFNDAVMWCEHLLRLIKDWGKELDDSPNALARIKELVKVKKDKQWSQDFATLYNTKKSWRKTMFEESIVTMQNEAVCMNALKHDSGLLSRNKEQIKAMCCNDTVSLRNVLRKIRIYWPHTLAKDWKTSYLNRLSEPNGHKALIKGLCALLSKDEINDLLKKYAPSNAKIDWNETDQLELSLRKQIAKNIHKVRPLLAVDGILPYAKGDYLQYAVPSLNSILSQLSPNKSRLYIPTLLDAPVSLQKFGVRCAFHKMTFEELKPMLFEIWNSTKNSSIRTVLFTHTFEMLCKEKNDSRAKVMWELLSMFIDNLTSDENKLVYNKLGEVSKIPDSIKPQFYTKSYIFLNSLPAKCNCEDIVNRMQTDAKDFMEFLDNDFVVNVMLKKFFETFTKEKYIYKQANVIATFILATKDEEAQMKRYEMCLAPLLDKFLPLWESVEEGEYSIKGSINYILEQLADNQTFTFEKRMQIPVKVFSSVQMKLENTLDYQKDYVLLTTWKLTVHFVKILVETGLVAECYKIEADDKDRTDEEKEKMYTDIHKQISQLFSKICVQILKEDSDRFGRSIYTIFARAFKKFFNDYSSRTLCRFEDKLEYVLWMLRNDKDKEIWLMVHLFLKKEVNNVYSDEEKKKLEEVREIVFLHPSDEVKMHYYDLFSDRPPFTPSTS